MSNKDNPDATVKKLMEIFATVNFYDGAGADAGEDAGEAEAPLLELRLWMLVKGDQGAAAYTRDHPAGVELVVLIDGDLHAAEAFTSMSDDSFKVASDRHRAALVADGWIEADPRLP